ncbi:MAG: hypothetical protein NZ898_11520 [Myxococcota bacterium]|nr:hypothetical protein [Myxococcota bacterium]MDW8361931.1 hypothetical protein [Myxococcales bacterium]
MLRDLGYRPYDGPRLGPSHNWLVMLRHGLRRAWSSWIVKLVALTGWIPPLVALVLIGIHMMLEREAVARGVPPGAIPRLDPAQFVRTGFGWQTWLLVSLVSTGAGATVIAEDLGQRAFSFYFSKPLTVEQYLVGRTSAVAIWIFALLFGPAVLQIVALAATATDGSTAERVGLLLPAFLYALLAACVFAIGSVGVSALSSSRALTVTAWLVLFFVPHVLGSLVEAIAGWPWLLLGSLPALLGTVADALLRVETGSAIRWFHAMPLLVLFAVGAWMLAARRLRAAEVVA